MHKVYKGCVYDKDHMSVLRIKNARITFTCIIILILGWSTLVNQPNTWFYQLKVTKSLLTAVVSCFTWRKIAIMKCSVITIPLIILVNVVSPHWPLTKWPPSYTRFIAFLINSVFWKQHLTEYRISPLSFIDKFPPPHSGRVAVNMEISHQHRQKEEGFLIARVWGFSWELFGMRSRNNSFQ